MTIPSSQRTQVGLAKGGLAKGGGVETITMVQPRELKVRVDAGVLENSSILTTCKTVPSCDGGKGCDLPAR